jgi:RHS repeat-associated protein
MTNTETFGYTPGIAGAVSYTGQTGNGVVLLAYDLLGQLTNQVFSGVATNRFNYNAAGDLTGLIDGLNQQTAWSYDTEGRAYRKVQNNDVIAWTNGFNANGWLTAHWTPARPNLTAYAYDVVGNLTNIAYTGGVSSNVSLTYDKNNRLATMDDAVGHTAFAWTPWGALASEDGPWADDTVASSHNASGLRSGLSLLQPDASAWSQTCRYDAAGNLTNRINGNFWQRFSQSADGLNQLSGAVHATDASYTMAGMVYGLATGVTVKQNAETTATNATLYADGSFVRTNVTLAEGTNTFTAVVTDALDRSATNTALAWVPATVSFTYDANGNLTGDGRRTFAYDDEDQLVSVTVTNGPNSSTRSTFVYDALGRRRVRTEHAWLNNAWVAQSVTRYVYDHMLVLQERDGDNAPTATYTRGLDLSGSLQGAGGIGGLLAFTQLSSSNPRHTYYHADAGGNITALIDDHATVLARYAYDPYGNLLGLAGPLAKQNLYRFSSKEFHPASGLYYYGYRFYEPSLLRWINRDPAGERASGNLFRYASNDALNHADAFGLIVLDPPADLGFTYGDIVQAFLMAEAAGITGPDGKRMLAVLQQMLASEKTVGWKRIKISEIPSTKAYAEAKSYPCDATIRFPKCDPRSLKRDLRGRGKTRFYFHAAILHEMVHAYQDLIGQAGDTEEEAEKEPTRIGLALNDWLDRNLH